MKIKNMELSEGKKRETLEIKYTIKREKKMQ